MKNETFSCDHCFTSYAIIDRQPVDAAGRPVRLVSFLWWNPPREIPVDFCDEDCLREWLNERKEQRDGEALKGPDTFSTVVIDQAAELARTNGVEMKPTGLSALREEP